MTRFEWLNSILGSEFDQYVLEHPDFAERIPQDAIVVLQLKGEDSFNEWARNIGELHREKDQPLLIVQMSGLKPQRSRLIRPIHRKDGLKPPRIAALSPALSHAPESRSRIPLPGTLGSDTIS